MALKESKERDGMPFCVSFGKSCGAPRQKDPVTVYFYFWPFFSLVLISAEATAWPRNCGFLLQNGHPFNSLAMILGDLQMLYET